MLIAIRFILLTFIFSCQTARSETVLNVVTEDFPRFQYINQDGEFVGVAKEIVYEVLNLSNIPFEISLQEWTTAYSSVLRRRDTCVFSAARNEVRENELNWVFPVGEFRISFYALKDSGIKVSSLEDAKKYKIAVIKDNHSYQFLKFHGFEEGKQLIIIRSFEHVLDILNARKDLLDLVILSHDQYEFKSHTNKNAENLQAVYELEGASVPLYFACNKHLDKSLIEKMKKAYREVSTSRK